MVNLYKWGDNMPSWLIPILIILYKRVALKSRILLKFLSQTKFRLQSEGDEKNDFVIFPIILPVMYIHCIKPLNKLFL